MTKEQLQAKIAALKDSDAFLREVDEASTPEEMIRVFADHGIEVSENELGDIAAQIRPDSGEELSEDDLENVSGGSLIMIIMVIKNWIRILILSFR